MEVEALWTEINRALDAGQDPLQVPQLAVQFAEPHGDAQRVREQVVRLQARLALLSGARVDGAVAQVQPTQRQQQVRSRLAFAAGLAAAALFVFATWRMDSRPADTRQRESAQTPLASDALPASEFRVCSIVVEHELPTPPTPTRIDHTPTQVIIWTLGDKR